jgi:hypothetical protein
MPFLFVEEKGKNIGKAKVQAMGRRGAVFVRCSVAVNLGATGSISTSTVEESNTPANSQWFCCWKRRIRKETSLA